MKKDRRSYRRNSFDLFDTGAAPYLLSLQAKWEQENMKIVYEKRGVKNYIQCMKEDHRII